MDEIIGKIEELDYYKLALKMQELQHEQTKLKVKEMYAAMYDKDLENLKLRIALHKQVISEGKMSVNDVKKDYESFRDELSDKLGYPLADLVIDPINFDVKKIK